MANEVKREMQLIILIIIIINIHQQLENMLTSQVHTEKNTNCKSVQNE